MEKNYIQQGDILLKPIDAIPVGAKKLSHKTLAEGEASNHFHVAEAEDVELYEIDGTLYMSAPSGTTVRHEEHKRVSVKPGVFKIDRVREYDHFSEESRPVID